MYSFVPDMEKRSSGRKLERSKRAALSEALANARAAKGWSQDRVAEEATSALRLAAINEPEASVEEREMWASIEVTRHHVFKVENSPANPISTLERRARLLGLTLALGVDRSLINRLAGGL